MNRSRCGFSDDPRPRAHLAEVLAEAINEDRWARLPDVISTVIAP